MVDCHDFDMILYIPCPYGLARGGSSRSVGSSARFPELLACGCHFRVRGTRLSCLWGGQPHIQWTAGLSGLRLADPYAVGKRCCTVGSCSHLLIITVLPAFILWTRRYGYTPIRSL